MPLSSFKIHSPFLTSLSCSQLELSNPRAAWRAVSGGLFTYFHNGQIRRVQCSMKRLRFQLWSEPASSSNIEFFVYEQNQCSLEAEELGQKTASSLFWYCRLFRDSHVFAVKVGLVKQYDDSVSNLGKLCCCCCCCCSQGSQITHWSWLFNTPVFYSCSLGVSLCNKNNRTDDLFSRQPPLWSSFYFPIMMHFHAF